MGPLRELEELLRNLKKHELGVKESARRVLLLKAMADADPRTPAGVKKGLDESLQEHRETIAELKDLQRKLPEQYTVCPGGDA